MNTDYLLIPFLAVAGVFVANLIWSRYRNEFFIKEGRVGLLYRHGLLIETLEAGRHVRWARNLRLHTIDVRKTLLPVSGCEVLTLDEVPAKISLVLTVQIADPVLSLSGSSDSMVYISESAGKRLRDLVSRLPLSVLLDRATSLGDELRWYITPQAESVGVTVYEASLLDILLPVELRDLYGGCDLARFEDASSAPDPAAQDQRRQDLTGAGNAIEGQPSLATLRYLRLLDSPESSPVMHDVTPLLTTRKKPAL